MQRGAEFSIMLGANELMNSRLGGSEAALASLACERIRTRTAARVLIGGLGMGFTLKAAQAGLGQDARIVVAELLPRVTAWARGPLAGVFGDSLADPRVEVVEADVATMIGSAQDDYDAILLDVDNGPGALVHRANDRLYAPAGLAAAARALRQVGVLGVWSAAPDEAFGRRLRQAGYAVTESRVAAYGRRGGPRHVVWIAEARRRLAEPEARG
ncbi:spermidine synthase [Caulobacter sp. S45]|uniref:spermidine synthase n=1 Tax=Caulobacter sp. S45 TaxID=1641861 RepID=UPI0020C719FA|nr:spermidine synthase [Caulobacter sp. S45]